MNFNDFIIRWNIIFNDFHDFYENENDTKVTTPSSTTHLQAKRQLET